MAPRRFTLSQPVPRSFYSLCLAAAVAVASWVRAVRERLGAGGTRALLVLCCAAFAAQPLAVVVACRRVIASHPDPRTQSPRWMAENVPAGPPVAAQASAVAARLGRPPRFLIGMGNDLAADHDRDGAYTLGVTFDLHDAYLAGLGGQGGWPDWSPGGTFVDVLARSADAHGVVPMFTLYQTAAWGEGNLDAPADDAFMASYWSGARLLFERLSSFDKPAVVHLEPDFWGFAQLRRADPKAIPVRVSAHAPECRDLPDDLTGMGRCLVRLCRRIAPRVVVGFHASRWAGGAPAVVAYLRALGAGEGDIVVVETLDRDAGCYEARTDPGCRRSGGPWYWDESNATSPNFEEHLAWARAVSEGMGKPVLWWQMPFGVPSDRPGGSPGHYRDNRVRHLFAHPRDYVRAGGLGAVFGVGAANQTYVTTDGGQFKRAVAGYYANPASLR